MDATTLIPRWLTLRFQHRGAIPLKTPLEQVPFVVLDSELTSLDRRSNRLLSVGAIAMQGGRIKLGEQFYRVLNPKVEVPAESILVHGLRPSDIAGGEPTEEVLRDLRQFIGNAVIVGHFAEIDREVLARELREIGARLRNPVLCTAAAHRWLEQHEHHVRGLDEIQGRCDLATLAAAYGIPMHEAHHALYDAFITAQLWQKLLIRLEHAGIDTLGKALRFSR